MKKKNWLSGLLWDLWCCISIVGIWPRFIEPNLLFTSKYTIPLPSLDRSLNGLKILLISDLHLNTKTPDYFLKKIIKKVKRNNPDLILFTGDFLCFSEMGNSHRLENFLKDIPNAPSGNYCVLGNHDYEHYAYINEEGDYDISFKTESKSIFKKGFKRIFKKIPLTGKITERAKLNKPNNELIKLLENTPFKLLHNHTEIIKIGDSYLNISGLGEYMTGNLNAEKTFSNYQNEYPGIILVHNPDGIRLINKYPGDIILSGHTHGGQINLPFISNKFVLLENLKYKKGYFNEKNKHIYVSRGLGSVFHFRWFSPPELTIFELKNG